MLISFLCLSSRKLIELVASAITEKPDGAWVAEQARNLACCLQDSRSSMHAAA